MENRHARKAALSAVRSAQNGMKPALSRLIFARKSPDLAELPHVRGGSLTESAPKNRGGLCSFAAIGHCVNRKATEMKNQEETECCLMNGDRMSATFCC